MLQLNKSSDIREQLCWDLYVEKLSMGVTNAYQSAVEAGYSIDHARNITLQGWFKERLDKLRRKDMLSKAERNLDKALDFNMITEDGKVITDVAKIVVDVSKNVTASLGKDAYSTRNELTGANGETLKLIVDDTERKTDTQPVA